jgi:cob(I)alamin adenosyltransferase
VPRDPDEPVRLDRIYTRGGDRGETSLGDGSRARKLDRRIAAYGTVDELNSALGVVLACGVPAPVRAPLEQLQNELFDLGADLSVPWSGPAELEASPAEPATPGRKTGTRSVSRGRLRVTQTMIDGLERLCDEFNEPLPTLKSFVLPGGTEAAARLHVARTIARRAELEALEADAERGVNPLALVYLNRVSDLLFVLARAANAEAGVDEPLWRPGGRL